MNKKLVISTTVLSIFILTVVGYQPIIAEEIIIEQVKIPKVENQIVKNDLIIENISNEKPVLFCLFLQIIWGTASVIQVFLWHLGVTGLILNIFDPFMYISYALWQVFCSDCIKNNY